MILMSRKKEPFLTPEREGHSLVSFLGQGVTEMSRRRAGEGRADGAGCWEQGSWSLWCHSGSTSESFYAAPPRVPTLSCTFLQSLPVFPPSLPVISCT